MGNLIKSGQQKNCETEIFLHVAYEIKLMIWLPKESA